ncbi:conserved hypothetical protein [Ricinus communis]|uniref:Uncharacterized protein n=1 Tax=Ricinus communis TaxID=3988 RepID=B9TCK4_RICCO|nr:conserved hypothetical protein [Ricinus communis]
MAQVVASVEQGGVGVVIEGGGFGSGPEHGGKAAAEHYIYSRFSALRPSLRRAERRPAPIEGADAIGHVGQSPFAVDSPHESPS